MNPGDFFLMLLSLVLAALSLLAHGWTLNGIGPALIATAGGVWQLWMQWLRHRSWLRHQASGFAPGTQHLALAATVGWSLSVVVAVFWTVTTLKGLQP
jgi:hypothetical protein